MSQFFESTLSNQQCGFRKDKAFGVLLTDLSKALDRLEHELLITKLNAYRLGLPALTLIHDYLSNRKQRTKVNCFYSEWLEF